VACGHHNLRRRPRPPQIAQQRQRHDRITKPVGRKHDEPTRPDYRGTRRTRRTWRTRRTVRTLRTRRT
jgi:hypothetical protein